MEAHVGVENLIPLRIVVLNDANHPDQVSDINAALALRGLAIPIPSTDVQMLLYANKAHVAVDGLVVVRVANVLKRATILREAGDLHLCTKLIFHGFLVIIEVFVLSVALLTATSGKCLLMLRVELYSKEFTRGRKVWWIPVVS